METSLWVTYYRRQWARFLVTSLLVVRDTFGMDWLRTFHGAWLVLRANQLWAPNPGDPDGARRCMTRFYALLLLTHGAPADPARAARLEVDWWAAHREHQYDEGSGDGPLVTALARLYAYVYDTAEESVRPAAQHRARAMDISDRWVAAGRDPAARSSPANAPNWSAATPACWPPCTADPPPEPHDHGRSWVLYAPTSTVITGCCAFGRAGSPRTSTATAPDGPQISGLMSRAARSPPSSAAIADTPVIAAMTAPRSAGGWPRNPASSRATRSRDSKRVAPAASTGGSATARSGQVLHQDPARADDNQRPEVAVREDPGRQFGAGAHRLAASTRGPSRAARSA